MKVKRNRQQQVIVSYDKPIVISYFFLVLAGLLTMLNLTAIQDEMSYFYRHLVFLGISIMAALMILHFFNLQKLKRFNLIMLGLTILMLVAVLVVGRTHKGGTRSISLGFISIQPSFIARVALIFFYAQHLSNKHEELKEGKLGDLWKDFYPLIIATIMVYALITLERHLSTLIISGATLLGMVTYAGIRMRYVLSVFLLGILLIFVTITFGAQFRSARLETYKSYFLLTRNASSDTLKADDYQVRESLTALVRGGWFGTGVSKGRAKHFYLPESRTDYVYTIIGEEFGFLGAMFIFGLHCLLFFRAFKVAQSQEDLYLRFLCAGLAMNIFFNVLVNTGVAMSILPSTGNTLPFISYGGTALLVDSASVGVILNISAKRRKL